MGKQITRTIKQISEKRNGFRVCEDCGQYNSNENSECIQCGAGRYKFNEVTEKDIEDCTKTLKSFNDIDYEIEVGYK